MQQGPLVICSNGIINGEASVTNAAPWILKVSASSIDRTSYTPTFLGNTIEVSSAKTRNDFVLHFDAFYVPSFFQRATHSSRLKLVSFTKWITYIQRWLRRDFLIWQRSAVFVWTGSGHTPNPCRSLQYCIDKFCSNYSHILGFGIF